MARSGIGSFESDAGGDAMQDFIWADDSISAIEQALRNVDMFAADEHLESDRCYEVLVAAELLAALAGHPGSGLPKPAVAWAQSQPQLVGDRKEQLHDLAERTVRSVWMGDSSELRGLHEEAGEFVAWSDVVRDLIARLRLPTRSTERTQAFSDEVSPFERTEIERHPGDVPPKGATHLGKRAISDR